MRGLAENTPLPEGESKDGGAVRPILFSGPMVRALLAGTKTQTRRVLKPQPHFHNVWQCEDTLDWWQSGHGEAGDDPIHIRIKRGDRLWVRESWDFMPLDDPKPEGSGKAEIVYWADADRLEFEVPNGFNPMVYGCERFRPSIHMPRWASRLTLTVTDVRVQRLQDISEDDAAAEGWPAKEDRATTGLAETRDAYPVGWYAWLWDSINGPGSWDANPWVVAYTFTVEHQNIDAALSRAQGDRT